MSRLIDADKLKAAITVDGYEHFSGCLSSSEVSLLEMVMDDIDEAPTINAVPVVRCRECDCSSMEGWYCNGCGIMPAHPTFPNEYCSKGRMTNNGLL